MTLGSETISNEEIIVPADRVYLSNVKLYPIKHPLASDEPNTKYWELGTVKITEVQQAKEGTV